MLKIMNVMTMMMTMIRGISMNMIMRKTTITITAFTKFTVHLLLYFENLSNLIIK